MPPTTHPRRLTGRFFTLLAGAFLSLTASAQTTNIEITSAPLRTGVERFGINLSGQTFYDSGQMLRNAVARNPGFEGELWQSIIRCKSATSNTCVVDDQYSSWPADFLAGARFEILSGHAAGATGSVLSSTAAQSPKPVTLNLTSLKTSLSGGDFLLVQLAKPGNPTAGWWTGTKGGASFDAEFHDLSPHTLGHQALRIVAAGDQQIATLSSYFDSFEGHSFVQLHGLYHLSFRAKPLTSGATVHITLHRLDTAHGLHVFLDRTLPLKAGWNDYDIAIPTEEPANSVGTVELAFAVEHASLLLDDVALTAPHSPANPTAFRDEVVQTLRDLRPGTLRYMDNGPSFGSSLDNLLTPVFARQRAGASTHTNSSDDIPIGIPEFLTLCEAIHANPWLTLPPGLSPLEAQHLIEYLSGPTTTPYGSQRTALGHAAPWTSVFSTIHLELGNEQWNAGSFAGATLHDPNIYGHRASQVFSAARSSQYFHTGHFDLVLGAWSVNTWWTQQELLDAKATADTIAIAPYLFAEFNRAPNEELTFGPMFAQPEQLDSRPGGLVAQQAAVAAQQHTHLAIYETNLGTMSGAVPQSAIDVTVPSLGAGLAVADHMLLMLRDLGITTQNFFCLPEYQNNFASTTGAKETIPLWGAVIDMGGATNRRRPSYLALQLVNQALLPTELATRITGSNPTWNQPLSPNDHIQLENAHDLQAFAFTDGHDYSLILFNLSRDRSLPIHLSGPFESSGAAQETVLTSAHITDNNERQDIVHPTHTRFANPQTLPPFSMTVITWTTP